MKKSLLAIAVAVLLFACSKEDAVEFTPTDLTGSTVVKGKVTKTFLAQSVGFGYTNIQVPAEGVTVTVRVQNNQLYPNSPSATGSKVYTGTTDADGNYSITVTTNGNGNVSGTIAVLDMIGTRDTVFANGTVTTGPAASFGGTTTNRTLVTGVGVVWNFNMSPTILSTDPSAVITGTAVVTGTLQIHYFEEDTTAMGVKFYTLTPFALPNHPIKVELDKDPTTQMVKVYSATTDANGVYRVVVETTEEVDGFWNQFAVVKVTDYETTRDTIKLGGARVTGEAGVYNNRSTTVFGVTPNEIKNQVNLTSNSFQ